MIQENIQDYACHIKIGIKYWLINLEIIVKNILQSIYIYSILHIINF